MIFQLFMTRYVLKNRIFGKVMLNRSMFLLGFIIRILLIVGVSPLVISDWYVPFIQVSSNSISIDPWSDFLNLNGNVKAFPYGMAMYFSFLPSILIDYTFASPLITKYSIGILFLSFDILVFQLLKHIIQNKTKHVLFFYWLNPIVIISSFWIGQSDIVCVAFLLCAIVYLKIEHYVLSALFLCCAISCKFSMGLFIPFAFLFFIKNAIFDIRAVKFTLTLMISSLVLILLPILYSQGYWEMVINTAESKRLFDFAINIGGYHLYLTFVLIGLIFYTGWKIAYCSMQLLYALTGLAFMVIILSTSTPPGWYLWVVPFAVVNLIKKIGRAHV